MSEKEIHKKRFNVILEQPINGFGEPGQRGFYDISEEETKKMIEKGAKIERITSASFKNVGLVTKRQESKIRYKLKKARRRR